MNSNSLEKVKTLEAIEKEIINCIQSAGNALQELGKDSKQSQKSVEVSKRDLKSSVLLIFSFVESCQFIPQICQHSGKEIVCTNQLPFRGHK